MEASVTHLCSQEVGTVLAQGMGRSGSWMPAAPREGLISSQRCQDSRKGFRYDMSDITGFPGLPVPGTALPTLIIRLPLGRSSLFPAQPHHSPLSVSQH